MTVTAWVRGTDQELVPLVSEYVNSSFNGWGFLLNSPRHDMYFWASDSNNGVTGDYNGLPPSVFSSPIMDGTWKQVAYVISNTGGKLYANAVEENSTPWVGEPGHPTSNTPLTFGGMQGKGLFGELDLAKVRIYNRALSSRDLSALYELERPSTYTLEV